MAPSLAVRGKWHGSHRVRRSVDIVPALLRGDIRSRGDKSGFVLWFIENARIEVRSNSIALQRVRACWCYVRVRPARLAIEAFVVTANDAIIGMWDNGSFGAQVTKFGADFGGELARAAL